MTQRIGITGANGFVGGWVTRRLAQDPSCDIVTIDRTAWNDPDRLCRLAGECDTIIHLAGVNRGDAADVESQNLALAAQLTAACRRAGVTPHLIYSSTTKRDEDSPYGRGKLRAEQTFAAWAEETGASVTTLVIPNVYGAGCRPFYNSVVSTFCHQLTHGERPTIVEDRVVEFVWVGDLAERIAQIAAAPQPGSAVTLPVHGSAELRITELLELLEGFRSDYFDRDVVPDLTTQLRSTLYTTFLSYVALADHVHRPPLHSDSRGDLCEVIKTVAGGQVFFSTTQPGVTRGNHYHTRKAEWFCVVRGEATIRLRKIGGAEVTEFTVAGNQPQFVSIPVLHTHSIENTGDAELLTLFWCNELFDPSDADTFYEDVLPPVATRHAA
ncbi:polysaccharide biosynthesis C-terminal domain-containing protein [Botrimarina colliarenosi]|uniref:polysaccharide biosynthesis C-terminal domain-containing protein n=1 Tax=Botrimarina colliarenosi TaxID=2528001 RepID=UPI0018D4C667|nr:NAD-dependent epimerase/dehydratase family protein [Botrimarina colliarenosi]